MEYSVCVVALQRRYGLTKEMCREHLAPFCFRSIHLAVQTFGGCVRIHNLALGTCREYLDVRERLVAFHGRDLVCAPDLLRNIDDGRLRRCAGRRMTSKRRVSFDGSRTFYARGGDDLRFDCIEVDGKWFADGGIGFRIVGDEVLVSRRDETVVLSKTSGKILRTTTGRAAAAKISTFVSPDGKTSALVDMDDHGGRVQLVRNESSFFLKRRPNSLVYDVDFSPDSTMCAFAEDRHVVVVDLNTARVLYDIPLPFVVDSIAFQT